MESSDSEDDSHSKCLNISFRRARMSDIVDVVKIYNDSIEYLDPESAEWIEGIVKKRSRRARIYVAVHSDSVIGFILVYKKRDRAYVDSLAVAPEHRGRGIGSCLLKHVEEVLLLENVERIYLTVKNNNHKALGIYLKNGYRISNIVLLLEALSNTIDGFGSELNNITVRVDNIRKSIFPRIKLLDTAIWSNFTYEIDDSIYKMSGEDAIVVTAYKGKRLLGIARVYIYQNKIVVERLALSFYRPTESLKAIISAIKTKLAVQPDRAIVIPVDSTKSSLLKTLISMGFRVVESEYVLYKDLIDRRLGMMSQNT